MESQFKAVFYQLRTTGRMPVREFIDDLEDDEKAVILALITKLETRGRLPMPYAEHLEGKIWQLRMKKRRRLVRLTYALVTGRRILLLNGFLKKTPRTPRSEIDLAQKYLNDHMIHNP